MSFPALSEALFDLLPELASEEYWIETEEGLASKPAFYIVESDGRYNLILNSLGSIKIYHKLKNAQDRIRELVENANYPMKVYRKTRRGKIRVNAKPFAVNTVQRMEPKEDAPIRAFNIKEWETLDTSTLG